MLARILRALRRHRGLRRVDVAAGMGLALRSYDHFEAGRGKVSLSRIWAFAEVTDTDPYAILVALQMGDPDFAVRCADNKMMLILMMTGEDFGRAARAEVARLDSRDVITVLERAFAVLRLQARQQEDFVRGWMKRPPAEAPPNDDTPD